MSYTAFISYNHNPRDIEVVKELQSKLEHFKIPKEIRENTGREEIGRVFLDIGELGVSADLNDDIKAALDTAEYLIVISSPESRASQWCRKEVEYFLTAHDMSQVLTVITAGEPKDVLPPEILVREEIAEDGTVTEVAREPLSCDYRMDRRKANKIELPRLVSAIIGCRYDDLIQRQKQYRTRRLIASLSVLTAVMIAALTYFIWSNIQIKENFNNTLREQSHSLALKSKESLSNGDRLGAIDYALEALPNGKKDRPIVSDAVLALAEATDIYKLPSEAVWTAIRRYDSCGNIRKMTTVNMDNKDIIAEIFTNGRIALLDSENGEELFAEYAKKLNDEGEQIINAGFTDDGNIIIVTKNKVLLLNIQTGKEIWNYSSEHTFLMPDNVEDLSATGDYILLPAADYSDNLNKSNYYLLKLDINDGSLKGTINQAGEIRGSAVSPDEQYMAFYTRGKDEEPDKIYVMDVKTDQTQNVGNKAFVTDIEFDSKGNLVACGIDTRPDDNDFSAADSVQLTGGGSTGLRFSVSKKRSIEISASDPENGNELWSSSFSKTTRSLPKLRVITDNDSFKGNLICFINNTAVIFDGAGKQKNRIDFESGIIDQFQAKEDIIRVIQENGEVSWFDNKDNSITTAYNVFIGPVEHVDTTQEGRVYISAIDISDPDKAASNDYITQYRYDGFDESWAAFEDEKMDTGQVAEHRVESFGDSAIKVTTSADKNGSIKTWSLSDGKQIINHEFPLFDKDDEFGKFEYVGIDADKSAAVFIKNNGGSVLSEEDKRPDMVVKSIDTKTGEETNKDYYYGEKDSTTSSYYNTNLKRIINGITYLGMVREDYDEGKCTLVVDELRPGDDTITQHNVVEIEKSDTDAVSNTLAIDADTAIFEDSMNRLNCQSLEGKTLWQTEELSYAPKGISLDIPERAIVFEQESDSVILHIHDMKDGKELSETTIDGAKIYSDVGAKILSDDEVLISIGNSAYILDRDKYELRTRIAGTYRGFNSDANEFILGSGANDSLGHVPYRSLEEMIKLGHSLLN